MECEIVRANRPANDKNDVVMVVNLMTSPTTSFLPRRNTNERDPNGREPYPYQVRFAEAARDSASAPRADWCGKPAPAVLGCLWPGRPSRKNSTCASFTLLPHALLVRAINTVS